MPNIRRIIHPTIQAPVLPANLTPETPMESKFHQPWSEPVRVRPALAIGDQQFVFFVQPAPQTVEAFFMPLSEPVRVKPGLSATSQLYEVFVKVIIPPLVGPRKPLYTQRSNSPGGGYPANYWKGTTNG